MGILRIYLEEKGRFVRKDDQHIRTITTGRNEDDHVSIKILRNSIEFTGKNSTTVEFYADEFSRFAYRFHMTEVAVY